MYATTLALAARASGPATEQLKLELTTVISSSSAQALSYALLPGQEVDVLVNLEVQPTITYYVIRANAPVLVGSSIELMQPATYNQPLGTMFAFAAPTGAICTSLRIKAPTGIAAPIAVSVQIGAN